MLDEYRVYDKVWKKTYEKIYKVDKLSNKVVVASEDNVPIELNLDDVDFQRYIHIKTDKDEKIYINDALELNTKQGPIKVYVLKDQPLSGFRFVLSKFVKIDDYLKQEEDLNGEKYVILQNAKKIPVEDLSKEDFNIEPSALETAFAPDSNLEEMVPQSFEFNHPAVNEFYENTLENEENDVKLEAGYFLSFLEPFAFIDGDADGIHATLAEVFNYIDTVLSDHSLYCTERYVGWRKEISFAKYKSTYKDHFEVTVKPDGTFTFSMDNRNASDTFSIKPFKLVYDFNHTMVLFTPQFVDFIRALLKISNWFDYHQDDMPREPYNELDPDPNEELEKKFKNKNKKK